MYLPLVSGRRLVAVLRLEAFLAQKPGFEDNDYSLSMISEHAGIAIESAWIRAHAKAVALQRQAVEHLLGDDPGHPNSPAQRVSGRRQPADA